VLRKTKTQPVEVERFEQVRVTQSIVKWPRKCACCGAKSDLVRTIQAPAGESAPYRGWSPHVDVREWHVPYCVECVLHQESSRGARSSTFRGMALLLAMLFGTGYPDMRPASIGGAILVTGYYLPYRQFALKAAAKAMKDTCGTVHAAVQFGGWDEGGILFNFYNPTYAAEFQQLNAHLLKP
jgi:hypothetical protein